jgi:hypothetical protein
MAVLQHDDGGGVIRYHIEKIAGMWLDDFFRKSLR